VWLEAADAPPHVSAAVTHPIHEPTRRAASKTLNRFSPERPTAFNDPAWIFEPKHDACRALVYLSPDDCIIRSKRGHTFRRFGALACPLRELVAARTAILDGKVLAVDSQGHPVYGSAPRHWPTGLCGVRNPVARRARRACAFAHPAQAVENVLPVRAPLSHELPLLDEQREPAIRSTYGQLAAQRGSHKATPCCSECHMLQYA
jgi:hypothetical protein